jgi:PhnB protein
VSASPIETSIAPWLSVDDGAAAVDYYKTAFGAVDVYRLDDDDGKVVVAQLTLGTAAFWVQEDGESSPRSRGSSPVRMIVTVSDPDTMFEQAVAAGASSVARVHEEYGWRTGRVTDPFGHDWEFSRPL